MIVERNARDLPPATVAKRNTAYSFVMDSPSRDMTPE